MKPIIDPVSKELLNSELTEERLLRTTNNAGNMIYTFKAGEAPNLMREVGRLREEAFRHAGGGTGMEVDIDEQDIAPDGYTQLIVWDPVGCKILGGYRYIICNSSDQKNLSTEHYFKFNDNFRRDILPHTIELGRSFVQPSYQKTRTAKSLYALDNLWDGLGALMIENPDKKYFFGKVTMYGHYDTEARNILMFFLHKYFPDSDRFVEPLYPVEVDLNPTHMEPIFTGQNYAENYRILVNELRKREEFIPPMINSYMSLSPSMRVFDTVYNPDFGEVEETGILIKISDIYPEKVERHTKGIFKKLKARIKAASGND